MLIVKKFGGSPSQQRKDISCGRDDALRITGSGHDVVVVLSAMGDTTDDLIAIAQSIHAGTERKESWTCFDHRRAGICFSDGNGYAEPGRAGGFAECVSGADAFYRTVWQCKIQED